MEMSSQREIRAIDPTWSLAQFSAHLANSLNGDGPALTLAPISADTVSSQISLVVTTSGSTGQAKEVAISAAALLAGAKDTNNFFAASPGQIWSLLLPLTHIAGINVLVRSLELGTSPIDGREISGRYPYADFTAIVPTQLFRALNGDDNLLKHLISAKSVLVGGAALDRKLSESARDAGINVVESYGMTETCGGCVYDGTPLGNNKIEINEAGLIGISTTSLATTYLNDPLGWNTKFSEGIFWTSDRGEIVDGKLRILGRADDVIITGGENISLAQIETVLSQTFSGIECAAFAVTDAQWGQALHLAIAGDIRPETAAINETLASQISVAAKVKGFLYLDKLPRTSMDKIDRQELVVIATKEGK